MIDITEFHRSKNGDDWTPALNYLSGVVNKIYFPDGVYQFKTPVNPFERDVRLISDGSVAMNDSSGVLLVFDHDGPTWNGGVPTTAGGGADRIKIAKSKGKSGGNGWSCLAQDKDRRASSVIFNDIAIHTSGYGRFAVGFNLDGSKVQDKGNSGCRDVRINGGRFAGCLEANMRLRWATTFQASHLVTMENKQPNGNRIDVEDSFYVSLGGSMKSYVNFRRTAESSVSGNVHQVTKDKASTVAVSAYQALPMEVKA